MLFDHFTDILLHKSDFDPNPNTNKLGVKHYPQQRHYIITVIATKKYPVLIEFTKNMKKSGNTRLREMTDCFFADPVIPGPTGSGNFTLRDFPESGVFGPGYPGLESGKSRNIPRVKTFSNTNPILTLTQTPTHFLCIDIPK
jgi:hypothetical protein